MSILYRVEIRWTTAEVGGAHYSKVHEIVAASANEARQIVWARHTAPGVFTSSVVATPMDEWKRNQKPHHGRIVNWRRYSLPRRDFMIMGRFLDHPQFALRNGHTSAVMHVGAYDPATNSREIETRNSRYTLIGEPVK